MDEGKEGKVLGEWRRGTGGSMAEGYGGSPGGLTHGLQTTEFPGKKDGWDEAELGLVFRRLVFTCLRTISGIQDPEVLIIIRPLRANTRRFFLFVSDFGPFCSRFSRLDKKTSSL